MDTSKKFILYIEDDLVDQMAFKRLMKQEAAQYQYQIVTSIEEARRFLSAGRCDVIISDFNLNDGNAFDILNHSTDIPVIITTGAGDEETAVKAMRQGAYDYLIKDPERNYLKILPVTLGNAIHHKEADKQYRILSQALKSVNELVCITYLEDRIVFVNDAFLKTYGFSAEELLGKNIQIIHAESNPPELVAEIRPRTLAGGWQGEVLNRRKNGEDFPIFLSTSLIYDDNGEPSHMIGVANDITERKRLEEELQKNQKLESLGILAGGIAHDFNNILTAIIGNISMAMIFSDTESPISRYMEEALKASEQTRDLTQQLLTFAKGGAPIKKNASIADLVLETGEFVARGSNVSINFRVPENVWLVEVDTGQISQVINNLVINAIQAMPEGGTIDLSIENIELEKNDILLPPGAYVKIAVQDEGTGISAQNLKQIFDPYFTTKKNGNGLGLATCYSIIKKHDGTITVNSELGRGSTFTIYLPAKPGKKLHEKKSKSCLVRGQGRILVMDDEEYILDITRQMLTRLGYHVQCTKDGYEALQTIQKHLQQNEPFNLVMLDLTVPGSMGGKEAIARLRKLDPNLRIVVMSGYSDDPVMANYREYGFSACLVKPFDIKTLSRTLSEI